MQYKKAIFIIFLIITARMYAAEHQPKDLVLQAQISQVEHYIDTILQQVMNENHILSNLRTDFLINKAHANIDFDYFFADVTIKQKEAKIEALNQELRVINKNLKQLLRLAVLH